MKLKFEAKHFPTGTSSDYIAWSAQKMFDEWFMAYTAKEAESKREYLRDWNARNKDRVAAYKIKSEAKRREKYGVRKRFLTAEQKLAKSIYNKNLYNTKKEKT